MLVPWKPCSPPPARRRRGSPPERPPRVALPDWLDHASRELGGGADIDHHEGRGERDVDERRERDRAEDDVCFVAQARRELSALSRHVGYLRAVQSPVTSSGV